MSTRKRLFAAFLVVGLVLGCFVFLGFALSHAEEKREEAWWNGLEPQERGRVSALAEVVRKLIRESRGKEVILVHKGDAHCTRVKQYFLHVFPGEGGAIAIDSGDKEYLHEVSEIRLKDGTILFPLPEDS